MGCIFGFWSVAAGELHRKRALTIFEQLSKVAFVDG